MAGKRNIMNAIKRAVSPKPQRSSPSSGVQSPVVASRTPLTNFICSRLRGDNLQLFALMFAEAIKNDRHAKVILFENVYKFLGYDRYNNAVRQLKNTFLDEDLVLDNLLTNEQVAKETPGPQKQGYLVSVRQFETLMLKAHTAEGDRAREMMLDVKDAVQDYMKIEMETSARQAQQQLDEETARRLELEAVQTQLQATIEAQKKREEKKEARKKQQKEPLETAYLMTNNADSQKGPFKSGCTGGDAKKRAKGMQTGNYEEMKVVASVKCMDAELVEKVMHRIFHDYRTNDRLEWFDTNLRSMGSVMKFVARVIDGLNCVDHDEVCIEKALQDMLAVMEEKILQASAHPKTEIEALEEDSNASDIDDDRVRELDVLGSDGAGNPVVDWLLNKCTLTGNHRDVASLQSIFTYYQATGGELKKHTFNNLFRHCVTEKTGFERTSPNRYESYHGLLLTPRPYVSNLV